MYICMHTNKEEIHKRIKCLETEFIFDYTPFGQLRIDF